MRAPQRLVGKALRALTLQRVDGLDAGVRTTSGVGVGRSRELLRECAEHGFLSSRRVIGCGGVRALYRPNHRIERIRKDGGCARGVIRLARPRSSRLAKTHAMVPDPARICPPLKREARARRAGRGISCPVFPPSSTPPSRLALLLGASVPTDPLAAGPGLRPSGYPPPAARRGSRRRRSRTPSSRTVDGMEITPRPILALAAPRSGPLPLPGMNDAQRREVLVGYLVDPEISAPSAGGRGRRSTTPRTSPAGLA